MEQYINWIFVSIGLAFLTFILLHVQYQFWTKRYKDPNKKDNFFTALFIFVVSFGSVLLIWTCLNMIALKKGQFVFIGYLIIFIFTSFFYFMLCRLEKNEKNENKEISRFRKFVETILGIPIVLGGVIMFFTSWGQLAK
jgi:hypothetical protein